MEIAMRRREQEVWQACDDLWAMHGEIRQLTGDAIRDRLIFLGKGRGSPNEIYKYRKTWAISRRVDASSDKSSDGAETDPITRAVRLVHEKLQSEAGEQINQLQEEFDGRLLEKEEEIKKAKSALDAVMAELFEAQNELKNQKSLVASLQDQASAEVHVRKAVEQELKLEKTLRDKEDRASVSLINEIKALHGQELRRLSALHVEQTAELTKALEKSLEEKKQLGYEYSEKLNEVKIELYHRDLIKEQLEKKLTTAMEEMAKLNEKLMSYEKQLEFLKTDIRQLSETLSARTAELNCALKERSLHAALFKDQAILLKRAEMTVTRLRAERRGIR